MESIMRRIAAAFLALAVLAPAPAALAQSGPLSVEVDHVVRLNLNGSAASVIIGNPQIADVTVVDARTLFVSGRAYGVTEIVVLDGAGRSIYQGEVVVSSPSSGQVRVWRGAVVTNMACGATCSPSVRGGEAVAPSAQTTP
jgi:Flp pilus assembly secretin CpaC